ncbi:hypothetical protein [Massilia rubra]|uniref:Uncharacterized protein n=1 Tax=Massilia rubra TaxID=2607910 RepID=A0ABX0LUI0_9BURK|nr:hypothetical protein [Massilia rubra]NHZ35542.1 hypothetical protein [Massilia rubra]
MSEDTNNVVVRPVCARATSIVLSGGMALLGIASAVCAQATALDYRHLLHFVILYGCVPQIILFAILAAGATRKFIVAGALCLILTWSAVAGLAARVLLP